MIAKAHVKNFRCLRDVEVAFSPLTILVGPNGAGKSALLAALEFREQPEPHDLWRGGGDHPTCELDLGIQGTWKNFTGNRSPLSSMTLRLDLPLLRAPNQLSEQLSLSGNGDNLVNVFASFSRAEQGDLAKQFCALVPMYADVDARPHNQGTHRLVFQDRWKPDLWYTPEEVSDGTILMLAFLVLSRQKRSVDLLAIEEPERGLHPYLLGELVQLLRRLATGQLGARAVQVILATHSAELLEFAEASEVRFLSRDPQDGSTRVETAPSEAPAEWAAALREYQGSLGALWLSGSLGGVPGGP